MTEKTTDKKRRSLTFPTDPLAVMQMDEIDAMARRAQSDQAEKPTEASEGQAAPTPKTVEPNHMASHMADNIASSMPGNTEGHTDIRPAARTQSQPSGGMAGTAYRHTDAQADRLDSEIGPAEVPLAATGPPARSARSGETARTKKAGPAGVSLERESRLSKALQVIEENDLVNITVRIPAKFNGFLDEYVDRLTRTNPKRRFKKQDAIAEALALFIADHPMPAMPATQDDF